MGHRHLGFDPDNTKTGGSYIAQLCQLLTATWDGDLIAKPHRDELVRVGYAVRGNGWNIITLEGIDALRKLNLLGT